MENILTAVLTGILRLTAIISPHFSAELAWSFFCKPRIRKKPLSSFEKNLQQQAKQFQLNSDNYKISVYHWPNKNQNKFTKTVILTHGWGGNAFNFSRLISQLIANNFNVIAYDSPAHGNSSGKQTNLLYNTNALVRLLEHVDTTHALIGHSFGTIANAYAFDLLQQSSQTAAINKLVLIAGPNKLSDIFASFIQTMRLPSRILDIFHQKVKTLTQRDIETMSTVQFLQCYSGESLVIHDEDDHIVPYNEAEKVMRGIQAQLFTTCGKGHFRILSADSVIDTVIEFLKKTRSSRDS